MKLGYQHVHDFLHDQSSLELLDWLAYERIEDEVRTQRLVQAMIRAGTVGQGARHNALDDNEEIIDTTQPEFAQQFQGLTNTPLRPQSRPIRPQSTEIKLG